MLEIRNLSTDLPTSRGVLRVVDDLTLTVGPGECFGLVGESGSGKSMTVKSILGLIPPPGRVTGGEVVLDGQSLRGLSPRAMERLRGRAMATIVQDAVSALNPVLRIGAQIAEAMLEHGVVRTKAEGRERAIQLMAKVGIPDPANRVDDYPHQFSGGMCQRVVIAAALSCDPKLILADEPTTALDVTIQDQILKLLVQLQADLGLSILLVTHDMGVVAQTCQRVAVMYAGQIVETATTTDLFANPRHPYTMGLLNCVPRIDATVTRLAPIPGAPPDLAQPPGGCRFHPRCPLAIAACRSGRPQLAEVAPGHFSRCIRQDALRPEIWQAEVAHA
jgi:peptide/nickel transport system ATP-binding protein